MFVTASRRFGLILALFAAPLPAAASILDYVGQCVPFARAASGVQIYGDAWTWWDQAEGRYPRGHAPRIGAVVAFARSDKLRLGHVAVVSRIVEKRVLMLTHANWSREDGRRGFVEQDVTLFDVSPDNDWSQVRVWYKGVTGLGGSTYAVHGFIYGPKGASTPQLSARQPDYVGSLIDAYAQ
ncbi:CHAP domain-containing protein [Sphingomonas floccifaciens]|uniref:CHAP domain-containing protein n=1 Tax=Sphingomonas floccifaciens TaxID=1844115 RepID=A0ABW4NAU2_9SPHN